MQEFNFKKKEKRKMFSSEKKMYWELRIKYHHKKSNTCESYRSGNLKLLRVLICNLMQENLQQEVLSRL